MRLRRGALTFAKFSLASLCCAAADQLLFMLFSIRLRPDLAYALARLLSGTLNYQIVRRRVLIREGSAFRASAYALLALCVMGVGSQATRALSAWTPLEPAWAKILCDLSLFLPNYWVQRKWVFRR